MGVIDRINHSELGEVSLRRVESASVEGRVSMVGSELEEGDLVIVFEEYRGEGTFPFVFPSELSFLRGWEDSNEPWDGQYDCFLCGEEANKVCLYEQSSKLIMAHDDCIGRAVECVETLIKKNPAEAGANVM